LKVSFLLDFRQIPIFFFKDFLTLDFRDRCLVVENKALNHFPRKSGAGKKEILYNGINDDDEKLS